MEKIINQITFLIMLLFFTTISAQNTATTTGSWNNCATWGNPLTIFNNTTDTKIINNGITVTQNTAWSTNNVVLNGTGGITFASQANSIDFVNDSGPDFSCCTIVTPTTGSVTQPSCANGKKGAININPQANAEYSINNGAYGPTTNFSNLNPGTYTFTVRSTTNSSCVSSILTVFLTDPGTCISPCTPPSGLAVSGAGSIGSCQTQSFVLTGSNISSASWSVSPTIGITSATSGTGTTASLTFNSSASGNYTVTFTANSTGNCTTTTATQSATVNVNSFDTFFTASGSSSNSIQTNATHAGVSTCNVTVGSGGFTYNVTGSYTVSGTINISSAGGSNHEVRHNRVGIQATNVGNTPFSITFTRNAGDFDNYFWMYTVGGNVSFTINDGKIHKN